MSYALDMEKSGPKKEIEMPPLPPEPEQEAPEQVAEQEPEVETEHETEQEETTEYQDNDEPEEQLETEEPETAQPQVSSKNERNIRYLREKAEQAEKWERERNEAMRVVEELLSKQQAAPKQQAAAEPEEEWNLNSDDLVEGKHLKRHLSKYDQEIRELREDLRREKAEKAEALMNSALRDRFPDIDRVLSKDNIAILNQDYPEIAATLKANTDPYTQASSAYTIMKKLGIDYDDPYAKSKDRAAKNAYKPRPVNSIKPQQGNSPLSKANAFAEGLTPELKKQLEREMFEARKNM